VRPHPHDPAALTWPQRVPRVPPRRAFVPLDLASISFLIVDDQPFTRRLVRTMLHGFGSREVYESAGGVEGLEMARTAKPNIIITDLIMPDFNGLRFIKMVKRWARRPARFRSSCCPAI